MSPTRNETLSVNSKINLMETTPILL
jgi:hypothetical protein